MKDKLRLAELLAIRLCHDFSGPLGTLMGSLEMVNEDPDGTAEALTLASDVATSLARRLRLLRAAWGGSNAGLALLDVTALAAGMPQAQKVKLDLSRLAGAGSFPPPMGRLLLNVLLLAGESLPLGGGVGVAGDPGGEVMVSIDGPRAAWPAGLAACLVDEAVAWQALDGSNADAPRVLQGPLTALIARAAGIRLSLLLAGPSEAAPPLLLSPLPR